MQSSLASELSFNQWKLCKPHSDVILSPGTVNNYFRPNSGSEQLLFQIKMYVEGFLGSSQNQYKGIYSTAITNPMRLVVGILFGSQLSLQSLLYESSRYTFAHKNTKTNIFKRRSRFIYFSIKQKRLGSRDSKTRDYFLPIFPSYTPSRNVQKS